MDPGRSGSCLHLLPFGIATMIIGEDPLLLEAARRAYRHWSAESPPGEPALELRLAAGGASASKVSLDIQVEGSRLSLSGGGVDGTADSRTGKASATVPRSVALDASVLAEVTDTLLLFLLARRGRTPVHASAFMIGDVAVVLAGPSGSGKSMLALAAAERGLALLSDDMVFVQREPAFAVWGFPRPIHLFPKDAPAGDHRTRIRNQKLKKAVEISTIALKAERTLLVLIEHGERLDLAPIASAAAAEALIDLDPGFDLLEAESRAAIAELASRGPWRLTLSRDPRAAIDLLINRLPVD